MPDAEIAWAKAVTEELAEVRRELKQVRDEQAEIRDDMVALTHRIQSVHRAALRALTHRIGGTAA
jgi:predicted trehalose synthase